MKFNENAAENLAILYKETNASIVLTTTHRISFDEKKWKEIFKKRGLDFHTISKLNSKTSIDQLADRATEISEWVEQSGKNENYVIIDDDLSLHGLPEEIKERWVHTKTLIGFDKYARAKALSILTAKVKFTCPCCGYKTLTEPEAYDICPVCRWEDDPFQLKGPDSEGGANEMSLKQAQKNFILFGACDEETRKNARQPTIEEPKDENWKPFE
ncbi:hypothetical protein D0T08_17900 [Emticicia sp. C21]|nr:hypothetical protein D0T08_17900 [Emticicia sp. C21]